MLIPKMIKNLLKFVLGLCVVCGALTVVAIVIALPVKVFYTLVVSVLVIIIFMLAWLVGDILVDG